MGCNAKKTNIIIIIISSSSSSNKALQYHFTETNLKSYRKYIYHVCSRLRVQTEYMQQTENYKDDDKDNQLNRRPKIQVLILSGFLTKTL